jgi:hypothetical protein
MGPLPARVVEGLVREVEKVGDCGVDEHRGWTNEKRSLPRISEACFDGLWADSCRGSGFVEPLGLQVVAPHFQR